MKHRADRDLHRMGAGEIHIVLREHDGGALGHGEAWLKRNNRDPMLPDFSRQRPDKTIQPRFRRGIARAYSTAPAKGNIVSSRYRCHADDEPAAALDHARKQKPAGVHRGVEVHVDHRFPLIEAQAHERVIVAGSEVSGIVDQDVDTPEFADCGAAQIFHVGTNREVTSDCQGFDSVRSDCGGGFVNRAGKGTFRRLDRPRRQNQVGALLCEADGKLFADTTAGPGYQDHFVLKVRQLRFVPSSALTNW